MDIFKKKKKKEKNNSLMYIYPNLVWKYWFLRENFAMLRELGG